VQGDLVYLCFWRGHGSSEESEKNLVAGRVLAICLSDLISGHSVKKGLGIHRDGRRSDVEEFNVEELFRLGYRAVSSIIVTRNLDCLFYIYYDRNRCQADLLGI
jgi:hypothetical protein